MKQSVSTPLMAAIIIVVVAIIGYFAWKAMQPNTDANSSSRGDEIQKAMKAKYPNMTLPPSGAAK